MANTLKTVMTACLSFGNQHYALAQVIETTGMERQAVRHRLWKLETAGLITRFRSREIIAERGRPTKEIYYRNTALLSKRMKGVLKPAHMKTNGWDKMWQVARALRRFTRNDLAVVCSQTMENVCAFTKEYRIRGYFRCLGGAGMRNAMWMLAKDPGPKRPIGEDADVD